jgi:hypothetical protein
MKKPRSFILAALGTAALAGLLGLPRQSSAQAPVDDAQAVAALAAEIAKQQAVILENQKVIDAKLAVIAENLRIAKIYVSRGGGSPPK